MSFLNQIKVWKMDTHSLFVTILREQCLIHLVYNHVFFCVVLFVVPGVLECTHILDVDNRFFPIRITEAHLSKVKVFFFTYTSQSQESHMNPGVRFCVLFQVDMTAETTLDLSMFPKLEPVFKLLEQYDFYVKKLTSGHLYLKGSFLKLKLIRKELIQLQHQSHKRAPPALHNGSTSGYDMKNNSLDPGFVSKSTSRNVDKMETVSRRQLLESAPSSSSYRDLPSGGSPSRSSYSEINASSPMDAVGQKYERLDSSKLHADRRSPIAVGASSLSANSPSSLTPLYHTSPLFRDSALEGSPRSLHSSYYSFIGSTSHTVDSMQPHTSYRDSASGGSLKRSPSLTDVTWASSSPSSPSSSSEAMASCLVDTDSLNFILTQKQDVVKLIEERFRTKMVLKDGVGITKVTFSGKNSETAKSHFLNYVEQLSPSLRTQEIHLKDYSHAEQNQILERIPRNTDMGVTITYSDDVVKLVGSSKESYEMKQKILGHDESQRGRPFERNSKPRRSSSLPQQYKTPDCVHITNHENVASKYSPSRYQEEPGEGKAPQSVRGREQTPGENSRRTRSNSESREKNRTTREQQIHQDVKLASASQEKKSPAQKRIDNLKRLALNPKLKDFNFKLPLKRN